MKYYASISGSHLIIKDENGSRMWSSHIGFSRDNPTTSLPIKLNKSYLIRKIIYKVSKHPFANTRVHRNDMPELVNLPGRHCMSYHLMLEEAC